EDLSYQSWLLPYRYRDLERRVYAQLYFRDPFALGMINICASSTGIRPDIFAVAFALRVNQAHHLGKAVSACHQRIHRDVRLKCPLGHEHYECLYQLLRHVCTRQGTSSTYPMPEWDPFRRQYKRLLEF
ncbi:hypothetical protein HDU89_002363, partial [Geranomyces variabilis]